MVGDSWNIRHKVHYGDLPVKLEMARFGRRMEDTSTFSRKKPCRMNMFSLCKKSKAFAAYLLLGPTPN